MFDLASNDTTAAEGSIRNNPSKTTSHERLRLTVVLTALSTGRKPKTNADIQNLQSIPQGNLHQECEQRGFLDCGSNGTVHRYGGLECGLTGQRFTCTGKRPRASSKTVVQ